VPQDDAGLSELIAQIMEGGGPCRKEFTWHAELIATADKALKVSFGGKEISGTNELLKVTFEVSGRCLDGDLTLDEPKKKVVPSDPTLGFKKPDAAGAGPWKKFTEVIPDAYDKFQSQPTITVNKKSECCAEISFAAELSSEGEFKVSIPVPGKDSIPVELKFPKSYPPVKAVWTICCCDSSEETCDWSARRDKFEWEKSTSADWTISWVLNADMGGCGKVKLVPKITKATLY
jgi:hypothetical protein